MVVDVPQYKRIVAAFREQPPGKRPNFREAARVTKLHERTIKDGWNHGWGATKRRPALPPIKNVFAPAPPVKSRASVSDQAIESVEKLLAISNAFITTISEVEPQIRGRLVERAVSEPEKTIAELNDLLKVIESAARSGERLATMGRALMDHRSSAKGENSASGASEDESDGEIPASTPATRSVAPVDVAARVAAAIGEDPVTPEPAAEGVTP